MKISIYNLGPIYRYTFDTDRAFQLLVGKNSVGKSYALTLVYIVLKELIGISESRSLRSPLTAAVEDPEIEGTLRRLNPWKEYQERDISVPMAEILGHLIDSALAERLSAPMVSSFGPEGSLGNRFSNEVFRVDIESVAATVQLGIRHDRICVAKVVCGAYRSKLVRTYRSAEDTPNGRMIYVVHADRDHLRNVLVNEGIRILQGVAGEASAQIAAVHYLPAIRSGLYQALSGLGAIVAQLTKSPNLVSRDMRLPHLTAPQNDYFLSISGIAARQPQAMSDDLQRIADAIEDQIVQGEIELDTDLNRMLFRPAKTDLRLDLGAASSMVAQVAPLVVYCRYLLGMSQQGGSPDEGERTRSGPLLVIEEPEAHLHPDTQFKLVSQLVALSKLGVKVVLTSHSDYIFNKISNLVILGRLRPEAVTATLLAMGEKGSEGKPLGVDAYGIDDENFIDSAESLYMEKAAALGQDA